MFSLKCFVLGCIEWLRPCWSRLGSDWVFLLILGIIMALISFVLDLAIEKCQTGEYKYYHTKTQLRDIVVQKFLPILYFAHHNSILP